AVLVGVITDDLREQAVLAGIFGRNFRESSDNRNKAGRVLEIYLRAIAGLFSEDDLWEADPKRQRLYHNVGLHVLLSLMDEVNRRVGVFSIVTPGKVNPTTDDEAVRSIEKVMKRIRPVDWSAGYASDTRAGGGR